MPKSVVTHVPVTKAAPAGTAGISSAATIFGSIAVSTQIPMRPDGSVELGDIRQQSRQVLGNLSSVLQSAGTGLGNLMHLTIYLTDINDRAGFNEVYEELIPQPYPARCALQVSSLARENMKVEITAIAAIPQ